MTEDMSRFIPDLFVIVIIVAIIETFLSARWSSSYFSKGITIYRREIIVAPGVGRTPTADMIEAGMPDSGWSAPILVRQIGDNLFAFREKLLHFGMGYTPVMHGIIKCDPHTGRIEVRGKANWFPVIFSCLFVGDIPFDISTIVFPLSLVGILTAIYFMQKKRFRQVEQVVLDLLENKKNN